VKLSIFPATNLTVMSILIQTTDSGLNSISSPTPLNLPTPPTQIEWRLSDRYSYEVRDAKIHPSFYEQN